MLKDLVKNRADQQKPRKEGLTYIIDRFQGLDKENFEILAPFIDTVKIHSALLASDTLLKRKIKFYHDVGVRVSTGSTITEFVILEHSLERFANEAAAIGFDTIEIGENSDSVSIVFQRERLAAVGFHCGVQQAEEIGYRRNQPVPVWNQRNS